MWMKIRKEETMTDNNISGNGQQQQPGMKCPQCDTFIETSIFQLLTTRALVCPKCHLRLVIDQFKSRPAFDALRKVQTAQDNLEKKSHFRR